MRLEATFFKLGLAALCSGLGLALAAPAADLSGAPFLVPAPVGLESMDAPVQAQYRQRRDALEPLLAQEAPPAAPLAEAFGELGRWFHAYGYLADAEAFYLQAQEHAPQDFRWPYYLGHTSSRTGGSQDAARAHFRRALELRPGDVAALVWLAEAELKEERLDEAEQLFAGALAAQRGCVRAMAGLGKIALARRDFAAAVRHLEAALGRQPTAAAIHHSLGLAYRGAKEPERARYHLVRSGDGAHGAPPPALDDPLMQQLAELRDDARLYQDRGTTAARQGRYADAAQEFSRAMEANPDNLSARVNVGWALLHEGRTREAIEQLAKVLELAPGHAMAHFNLGQAFERQGDPAQAIGHFRAALVTDPRNRPARERLAALLLRAESYQEALVQYEALVDLDPGNAQVYLLQAAAFIGLERLGSARGSLETGLALAPGRRELTSLLARILAAAPADEVRDGKRALLLATEAFEKKRSLFDLQTVAMAYAELGDFEQAQRWQRQAVAGADQAGRPDLVERTTQRLRLYESRQPCRVPFLPGEGPS
jgi:tetratricopeptide (TPR) repeat protein